MLSPSRRSMRLNLLAGLFAVAAPVCASDQPLASLQGTHLFEAAQSDQVLAQAFAQTMEAIARTSPWVRQYGTTSPASIETIDGRSYVVFQGCKPHDCVSESYAALYDPQRGKMRAVFVQSDYAGPSLTQSRLSWLGKPEFEHAKVLGRYLF